MHDDVDTTPGSENYEQRDANVKPIFYVGLGLVVITLIAYLVGYVIMNGFESREPATEFAPSPIAAEQEKIWAEGVRLQVGPQTERQALEADFARRLKEWDTVSETPEIYQIPVEVALDVVAEHGIPEIDAIPEAGEVAATETQQSQE